MLSDTSEPSKLSELSNTEATKYNDAFGQWMLEGDKTALLAHLASDDDPNRLNVYRNTFVAGSIDTLERHYPSVLHALTQNLFRQVARAYVHEHPPTTRSMADYGRGFPEFLDQQSHTLNALSFVSDLSRLDSAWSKAYFAAETTALEPSDINEVAASIENVRLRLSDNVTQVTTKQRVVELWSQLRDGPVTLPPTIEDNPQNTLLFRAPTGAMRYSILSESEIGFVTSIEAGLTLIDAAQYAADIGPLNIADVLASFLANGILQRRE